LGADKLAAADVDRKSKELGADLAGISLSTARFF